MKKFVPHIVAIAVFLTLTFAYLYPVLQGKTIFGADTQSYMGMSHEAVEYNNTHDEQTLWTGAMFGGMPTYQISMSEPASVVRYIDTCLRVLPGPTYRVFLYLIGFYILLVIFGVNPWLSIGGAVAFAFGSYNLIIIVAGHNTKAVAIAYMAPIVASIYYAFKNNSWRGRLTGTALLALFLGLGLYANHVQIIYYTLFIVICLGISELVFAIREKTVPDFFKTLGLLVVGALMAVGLNATRIITTQEYVKATMRGESNGLTVKGSDNHGLDKDYITAWSYGIGESFTLMIPNFRGGGSAGKLDADSKTAEKIGGLYGYKKSSTGLSSADKERLDRVMQTNPNSLRPRNLDELMYTFNLPLYWGDQPFTSGPVYVGAIICFLFLLGMIIVPGREKWWLFAAAVLGLLLSWGRNFMPLTDLFIDYVPMYNKFRTVSMTLTITCLAMCILALLGVKELFSADVDAKRKLKALYISAGVTGFICLLFWVAPSLAGSFVSPQDAKYTGGYAFLQETLPLDRMSLLSSDALRSLIFILLTAAVLFVYVKGKINTVVASVALGVLFAADMIPIAARYLSSSDFVEDSVVNKPFSPSFADKYILKDKSLDFRVLDATVDIFNSSKPAYFHKDVGGYSAVKLRRYQELIDVQLSPELDRFAASLRQITSEADIYKVFGNTPILNMLNTKYVIISGASLPLLNKYAYGNAWLVDKVQFAATPDDEIDLLDDVDLQSVVLVDKNLKDCVKDTAFNTEGAEIQLISYEPNRLEYAFSAKTPQLAVFSEIFYYTGWHAYIGEKEVPFFRADYLLRAMNLDAGNYKITFVFDPSSYRIGKIISIISSILLTLAFCGIIFAAAKRGNVKK
ncbi:MAG: YfhO family protein [Paludibacteraceae bacterium]|nr:YfhO family protein [Paludibacteraceae bacterium]